MDSEERRATKIIRHAASDEAAAVEFLERRRWTEDPCCVHCGSIDVYRMMTRSGQRNPYWRWRCRDCKSMYSVRTGTPMEESKLPLRFWVHAMWRACASKKGCAAKQIERELGVAYQTALFLMHRVRRAMADDEPELLGGDGLTVEADETYVGGMPRYRNTRPRGRGTVKQSVFAAVERNGNVRMSVLRGRITSSAIGDEITRSVSRQSRLVTDDLRLYRPVGATMLGGHGSVNHSNLEYAARDLNSNTAESVFAISKRGLYGIFHSITRKHLHRYLGEFEFRWNTRRLKDHLRLDRLIRTMRGKRLMYENQVMGMA